MKNLIFAFLLPVALLFPLTSCETYDAVGAGNTVAQKTFALYGEFVIAKELAADIVENPATPNNVVRAIVHGNRVATPAVHLAVTAARAYVRVQKAEGAGPKVAAALNELITAYTRAEPEARNLINAVNSIK